MNQATEVQPTQATLPDTVEINDVNQFAAAVAHWHAGVSSRLRHLLTVPSGTAFEVDGKELVLEGDVLKGFLFGTEMSIMQVGQLPFVMETSAEEPTDAVNPG